MVLVFNMVSYGISAYQRWRQRLRRLVAIAPILMSSDCRHALICLSVWQYLSLQHI